MPTDNVSAKQFFMTVLAGSIGAIVGASTTGLISYKANQTQFERTVRDREALGARNERALLQVLQADLKSIQTLHTQMNALIKSIADGEPFLKIVPISLNYFAVFENNVFQLGSITNADLRGEIILVYQMAKSLVDSIRLNNEMHADYRRLEFELKKSPNSGLKEQFEFRKSKMVEYSPSLKASSNGLMTEIASTLARIDAELVKSH